MNNLISGFHKQLSNFKYGTSYAHLECAQWATVLDAKLEFEKDNFNASKKYLYLGNNYTPGDNLENPSSLNMFGGFTESYYSSLVKFLEFEGTQESINFKIPHTFLNNIVARAKNKTASTYSKVNLEICEAVREKALQTAFITPEDAATNAIMIGDSHCYSMAPAGVPCKKLLAATLFGSIRKNLLIDFAKHTTAKHIHVMLGSVDIMFHIHRQPNPTKALNELIVSYISEVKKIIELGKTVEICAPTPIVSETRKLTKTTSYLGKHYFGSRDERIKSTLYFINKVQELIEQEEKITFVSYPFLWYNLPVEIYHSKLERTKGHHINLHNSRMNNFNHTGDW